MSPASFSFEDMRKAVQGDEDAKARCLEWVGDAPTGNAGGSIAPDGTVTFNPAVDAGRAQRVVWPPTPPPPRESP